METAAAHPPHIYSGRRAERRGRAGIAAIFADRCRAGRAGATDLGSGHGAVAGRPEGDVTEQVLDWYARFARGRPGAIVVEATGIRDVPSGPLLRIGHDRYIAGLRRLAELVRRESGGHTRLFIQLIDFLAIRRRPDPRRFFEQFLVLTDRHRRAAPKAGNDQELRLHLASLPADELADVLTPRELEALRFGFREHVTDTDVRHIRELPRVLPDLFATAAVRAREAGFDGVELHYAHAYTMASFLSATNDRADRYGGCRENRVRLPLEVYRRVRQRLGNDFVVGARFLAEECVPGGSSLADAEYFRSRPGARRDGLSVDIPWRQV